MAKIVHLERLTSTEYFKDSGLACIVREMHDAPSNETIAMHDHDFSELVLVASGSLNHIYSGGTVRLRAGDFFVIHPGERHGYAELAARTVVFNLLYLSKNPPTSLLFGGCPLMASLFPKNTPPVKADTLGRVARQNIPEVVGLVKAIRREEDADHPLRHEVCSSLFTSVILLLSREACNSKTTAQSPIRAEVDYIAQNIGRKISLADICAVSGRSVSTLSRMFRNTVGRSPGDYVIAMRVAKAQSLLAQPGASLEKVAGETGFCNASHLSRTLRRTEGRNPTRK
ncbi:MAG: helix-turn-helix domain-containing protein [Kiritimatiellae bacterium]|nr:helix-turn-helix domain-containing protein [Kiritimatiellia bacterium]MBQ3345334.1 helix-turn-helix domain-containing protein [Kiritimatiellia bacterium]